MTIAFFPSIHSEHAGESDGVSFTATVKTEDGRIWNYRGTASGTALAMLASDRDPLDVFSENRLKFAGQLGQSWRAQPEFYRYQIDSTNVEEGGGFVNNG